MLVSLVLNLFVGNSVNPSHPVDSSQVLPVEHIQFVSIKSLWCDIVGESSVWFYQLSLYLVICSQLLQLKEKVSASEGNSKLSFKLLKSQLRGYCIFDFDFSRVCCFFLLAR